MLGLIAFAGLRVGTLLLLFWLYRKWTRFYVSYWMEKERDALTAYLLVYMRQLYLERQKDEAE